MASKKITYVQLSGGRELDNLIASMTFYTKRETAQHYPFYIYILPSIGWRAPLNSEDPRWPELLDILESLQEGKGKKGD